MWPWLTGKQGRCSAQAEMVHAGVDRRKLEELFPGLLDGLDVELLGEVQLGERIVPPEVLWGSAAARMMASNNWVVSGSRTESGKPILCNDPHLEGNRLPAVWCEVALHLGERYAVGGSMPGARAQVRSVGSSTSATPEMWKRPCRPWATWKRLGTGCWPTGTATSATRCPVWRPSDAMA